MKIAVLVKQIPATQSLRLDVDGRLVRSGIALEMNPFCRRAVTQAVSLAREFRGTCTAITLAPQEGEDVLREAVASGADCGVLISDPAFAGSDTLATARAIAAALRRLGPFDLVVCGRNSVDADTGQVGPQVAEFLDKPFLANAREVKVRGGEIHARSERDDGSMAVWLRLPAVISVAERACPPARADLAARAAVPSGRIVRLSASDLGPGPWGQAGSPTRVGKVRPVENNRHQTMLNGSSQQQVKDALQLLISYGAFDSRANDACAVPESTRRSHGLPLIAVLLEPKRELLARELATAGAMVAASLKGKTVGIGQEEMAQWPGGSWGLDQLLLLIGAKTEEDVAGAVSEWSTQNRPKVILAPGTLWGREVAARVAAALGVGLIGDAVEITSSDDRLIAWKPSLGGRVLAKITTESDPQMATIRPGAISACAPRTFRAEVSAMRAASCGRVIVVERDYDHDADALFSAEVVVGVGTGVHRSDYDLLTPLLNALHAPLACTRKVADNGWLPRNRQVGLTGHHIAPQLYVAVGVHGGFNHTIGIRRSAVVLAVNHDRAAPIFEDSDVGLVGNWREAIPLLANLLAGHEMKALIEKRGPRSLRHHPNSANLERLH